MMENNQSCQARKTAKSTHVGKAGKNPIYWQLFTCLLNRYRRILSLIEIETENASCYHPPESLPKGHFSKCYVNRLVSQFADVHVTVPKALRFEVERGKG